MLKLVELGWGRENSAFRQVFANQFIPDATAEQLAAFDEIQRTTVSGEAAAALLRTFYDIDVVAAARQVRSPTLVLHATADARIPHMNHIFSKLGVGERSQLIVLARDAGFGKGAHA